MEEHAAFAMAEADWKKANPGRIPDKVARDKYIIPRVLKLIMP
jgi:hypothetical protein